MENCWKNWFFNIRVPFRIKPGPLNSKTEVYFLKYWGLFQLYFKKTQNQTTASDCFQ